MKSVEYSITSVETMHFGRVIAKRKDSPSHYQRLVNMRGTASFSLPDCLVSSILMVMQTRQAA